MQLQRQNLFTVTLSNNDNILHESFSLKESNIFHIPFPQSLYSHQPVDLFIQCHVPLAESS